MGLRSPPHDPRAVALSTPPGAPTVALIDGSGLDDAGLRAWARAATPDALYVSRSYRFPLALIALHHAPLGVDIERVEALDSAFTASIVTPAERRRQPDVHPSELWCSKEALAKALGDALRYDPRRLESPIRWPGGRCGPWRAARLAVPSGYVAWLCWRLDASAPTPTPGRKRTTIIGGPC